MKTDAVPAVDHVGVMRGEDGNKQLEMVFVDDSVSYESVSPTQLVEYAFQQGEEIFESYGR